MSVACVLFASLCIRTAISFFAPEQPSYQGKPLGVWLEGLSSDNSGGQHYAEQAFAEMGTAAVPWLIPELRAQDSVLRKRWEEIKARQSFIKLSFTPDYERRRRAVRACIALGPGAREALPALTENIESTNTDNNIPSALGGIGIEAVFALTKGLTNSDPDIREGCSFMLLSDTYGFRRLENIQYLISKLQSTDREERFRSAMALGLMSAEPEIAVPAIAKALTDPDPEVRGWAAIALGLFGNRAQAILPVLEKARNDENELVRETIEDAVEKIRFSEEALNE